MKKYTCTKHCIIGGKRFFAGDEIPGDLIEPSREQAMFKYGLFSVADVPNAMKLPEGKKDGKNAKASENPSGASTIGDNDEQKPETEKPGEKVQE
ncbi:MAG: hypothetical protein RSD95_08160 [Clostridia bacterium]